ncbi:VIT1/CCC1 transporter family protein [Hansschlegelia sp. KR7-227]|uniref:VIT1/CCC1 transporter family protein n=1 Tax=Hansschlegelia sp. KR7-227 TaxID=3400914 RepID=UPI003C0064B2
MQPHDVAKEAHLIHRIGWLRAAVLGANDGIVSTASLIVGVAAAAAGPKEIAIVGFAGLVAGAMSMAAGEYVSVSSQSDTETADLARERRELKADPAGELAELAAIYVERGLDPALARQVAEQLTAKDPLAAHARDELGLTDALSARPFQAAWASAASFATGAALPLATALAVPAGAVVWMTSAASLAFLAALGVAGAKAGGASLIKGAARVTIWGAAAMALTAAVGAMFGARV